MIKAIKLSIWNGLDYNYLESEVEYEHRYRLDSGVIIII